MTPLLLSVGVGCILAAIVGGGFKGLGIEIPVLQSGRRQISLAIAGVILLASAYYNAHKVISGEELRAGLELYDNGDFTGALHHFSAGAKARDAESQYHYGAMLFWGEGTAADQQTGLTWIRKAADQGNAPAEALLAIALATGQGVKKDVAQAKIWAERSADHKDPSGEFVRAILETDKSQQEKMLFAAAGHKYAPAQTALAELLTRQALESQLDLPGLYSAINVSAKWFELAAVQGEPNAAVGLAEIYDIHARRNPNKEERAHAEEKAYLWLLIASQHQKRPFSMTNEVLPRATALRKSLEEELDIGSQLQAEESAKSFQPQPDMLYRHH
jgi:TPR repeat protein